MTSDLKAEFKPNGETIFPCPTVLHNYKCDAFGHHPEHGSRPVCTYILNVLEEVLEISVVFQLSGNLYGSPLIGGVSDDRKTNKSEK